MRARFDRQFASNVFDWIWYGGLLLYALSSTHTISGVTGGLILASIGWVGRLFLHRHRKTSAVSFLPLLFLLTILASTIWSGQIASGMDRFRSHAGKILIFYVVAFETLSRTRLRWLSRTLVLGALIAVAYELGALALGRSNFALLADNRALGGMLGMLIPFSFTLLLVESRRVWKAAVFGSLCLMGVALVLSSTRGAWAGCLAGMTFVGIVADKRALGVVLLAVLFFFVLSPRGQVQRALNTFDSADMTITKRAHLWRSGLRMAQENPLFGKGPGSYKRVYRSYLSSEGRKLVRPDHAHAHNIFIHTLAETGIVGFSALILVLIAIARRLWLLQRRLTDLLLKTMVAGLMGGLLGFLVHGQVDYTLAGRTGFLFWFYLGLAFQCERLSGGD